MLAELHCHTTYSTRARVKFEGLNTPDEMVAYAKRIGIDALAITDHNVALSPSHAKRLEKKHGILVIPGEEVSSSDGHILALGISELIKDRLSAEETIERIHDQGGVAIAPHPFDVYGKGIGTLARKCDAIEVFNAINHDRISNFNSHVFAKKHRLPSVAGSDAHCTAMLGYGLTRMENVSTIDGILKSIKRGNTSILRKYTPPLVIMDWSVRRLKMSYDEILEYIDNNYRQPKRLVARQLLGLVDRYPGNIRYLFNALAYFGLGSVIAYSIGKEILSMD